MLSWMVFPAEQCWHIQISYLQAVRLTDLALAQDKVRYHGESKYSAGMDNGVGKLPTSAKTLREDLHSFYSYNEYYQKDTGQKANLFLIKVGSQSLEVFISFQLRQPKGSQWKWIAEP